MLSDANSEGRSRAGTHSVAEVASAIEALDPPAFRGLHVAARKAMRRYGPAGVVHGPEDLLQEAFLRLLSGRRSWRRGVDFEKQVRLAMRSIARDWRRRSAAVPEVRETDLVPPEDSGKVALEPLEPAVPERPMEARMFAAGETQKAAKLFADDPAALQILECLGLELTREEMCQRTGMSRRQVEAILRRVRRRASRRIRR